MSSEAHDARPLRQATFSAPAPAEPAATAGPVFLAREQERRRIASELHDDTVQVLWAVGLRLGRLLARRPDLERDTDLERSRRDLVDAAARLRHLLFNLAPPTLESAGLAEALRSRLAMLEEGEGAPTWELVDRTTCEPASLQRMVLYRNAQEALQNVSKHAHASRVWVDLAETDQGHLLRVTDDGVGFSPVGVAPGHLGLAEIKERSEAVGGWFGLATSPGEGTRVESWVPHPFDPACQDAASCE